MRFLIIVSWKPKKAKEITERFKKWTVPEGIKMVLPPHAIMGKNQSVGIVDVDDPVVLAKVDRFWRDISIFEFYPIMETREIIKIKP